MVLIAQNAEESIQIIQFAVENDKKTQEILRGGAVKVRKHKPHKKHLHKKACVCGKEYKGTAGLAQHKRWCKKAQEAQLGMIPTRIAEFGETVQITKI